jgi:catechol 2,3-dioxygenase-like lactoylglutathione lyase family enzyme
LSGAAFEKSMDVEGGAESITLGLGSQRIDLLQFDSPGQPYPMEASSSDLIFQHFAIVVTDIRQAYQRLLGVEGWSPISNGGPQRLPESFGGVTAFKFRDPDGHPLEFIAFPDMTSHDWKMDRGLFSGIDHSAIVVRDTARSIAFYEALGLSVVSCSLNSGIEQAKLDGICEPRVEVTALAPRHSTPHVELLCYGSGARRPHGVLRSNDVAATRLVLETERTADGCRACQRLCDPDGHHLLIVPRDDLIHS